MSTTPTTPAPKDPIMDRLEDQITWYDAKSSKCQKLYKRYKRIEIIAAALIPFLAVVPVPDAYPYARIARGPVTALLGVLITILEGVLQLNQYQQLWVTYRTTCEALNHEKFTYMAKGGVYATAADPHALLAERIETIMSQENSKWTSLQQQPLKVKGAEPPSQPVQ